MAVSWLILQPKSIVSFQINNDIKLSIPSEEFDMLSVSPSVKNSTILATLKK